VRFRQIVVTGPPGGGKSTVIERLGGWPQEGLLDLSAPRWWASRELSARPREVHLALPFRRVRTGLPLHDETWRDDAGNLELAPERIVLPEPDRWWRIPWRSKYVFDFQIPPAEVILEAREKRAEKGSHPIDENLEPFEVERQVVLYWEAARRLHQAGFRVIVRTEPAGPPLGFTAKPKKEPPPSRRAPLVQQIWSRASRHDKAPTVDVIDGQVLHGDKIRIPHSLLPVVLTVGKQSVRIDREPLLDVVDPGVEDRIVLHDPGLMDPGLMDPKAGPARIHGQLRLDVGERSRLGSGGESRFVASKLPRDSPARLEIVNLGDGVVVSDLESPSGTQLRAIPEERSELLIETRRRAVQRLQELIPSTEAPLPREAALSLLQSVLASIAEAPYRPKNRHGNPGGLVSLPPELVPIVVGDLHTNLDNLLGLLTWNAFLPDLEAGRAVLVLLGDAVHRDRPPGLDAMESSMVMMDAIFALMAPFPGHVLYVRGNHDSFSSEVRKASVPQGYLWREALFKARGQAYVDAMENFYEVCPYVVESPGLVACHAGPPMESMRRQDLVEIADHPRLRHQLTWTRFRAPNNPAGYGKRETKDFLKALGQKKAQLLVSHTPPPGERSFVRDLIGIKRHHIVYAASPTSYAVATRVLGEVVLLEYPGEVFGAEG